MNKEVDEKWIENTALLFYQIFSINYEDEKFEKKLLKGGGGNSTLCSTWTELSDCFVKYRISKKAYKLLISIIDGPDRKKIIKNKDCVTIPTNFIYKDYAYLFSSNEKGAKNRKEKGQYFHIDHNPSNKKVLTLLNSKIKEIKNKEDFLKILSRYIKKIQTKDLITVEEDDIRTQADRKREDKLSALERDKIIDSEFYDLIIYK